MKQIIIKKWIDGEFREVKRYFEEEVVSIRHHTDGLEVILKGNIRLYDTQCVIEFEEKNKDERIRKAIRYAIIHSIHSNGTLINGVSVKEAFDFLEKQDEHFEPTFIENEQKSAWSENDEKMWVTISDLLWEGYKLSDKKVSWDKIRFWLLSKIIYFKDRVQPQPKLVWSEEDELNLNQAIYVCHQHGYDGVEMWLKSFKERMKGE